MSGLTVNDPVFVTAYDNLADGTNDLVEGHESWYSEDIIPNASITSTDTVVICQGNNTVLFANNYPNTQYQWQKNGVNTGVNADSLNVTQAGNYRVIETNINGCKDTSNVVVVNVNSLSIENFTSTIVCGQLIPLNNTINYIGNNTINYSWISDPTLDNISIAHPNANPINTTTYTVNATDGVCQATATATITVNPLTVDAGYDQTIICGGSAQLDNVSTNYTGTGTLTYSWSPNIGLNNTSIANPTATITSDQTYFVTVTTDNGCIATDDITVTVNPLPTVTASANPAVICNGGTSELTASGTDNYSWSTGGNTASITVTPSSTTTYTVTGTSTAGCSSTATVQVTVNTFSCGDSLTVTHTAGSVAPVNKTVTYGTVSTNLSGATKCWITQNLGATDQASSATDSDEPSAGWYLQFNRKQGYKHDGTTRTPNTTWIAIINENSDWQSGNDPCRLLLGAGWRIPTKTEWENADATGGWDNYTETYASVLKLHAAGDLENLDGSLFARGFYGTYWSSTQYSSTEGWSLVLASGASNRSMGGKTYGLSVRCLRD